MRMKTLAIALFALGLAAVAEAQTHPCDNLTPPSVTRKSPVVLGGCWDQKDIDGNAAVATSLEVLIDGVVVKTIANPTPQGAANAAGLFYYQATGVTVSRGARTGQLRIVTVDGVGDLPTVYTFQITGGKPSKMVGVRVE